jgi:hypothetical protein
LSYYNHSNYASFKRAFKNDELSWELRHEDAEMGTYNKYNKRTAPVRAPITNSIDMKTFDEWKALGKWIKKGSKATNGKFSADQIK